MTDDLKEDSLCIGGLVGTRPIQISGFAVRTTDAPDGDRGFDRVDFAFWQPSAEAIARLGVVEFLNA